MDKTTLILVLGAVLLVAAAFFFTKGFPEPMTGSVVLTTESNDELCAGKVIEVLSKINDPERDAPLAEIIGLKPENVNVEGSKVTVIINLPSYCPFKDSITSTIKEEVGKIEGVKSVEVKLREELVEE